MTIVGVVVQVLVVPVVLVTSGSGARSTRSGMQW